MNCCACIHIQIQFVDKSTVQSILEPMKLRFVFHLHIDFPTRFVKHSIQDIAATGSAFFRISFTISHSIGNNKLYALQSIYKPMQQRVIQIPKDFRIERDLADDVRVFPHACGIAKKQSNQVKMICGLISPNDYNFDVN